MSMRPSNIGVPVHVGMAEASSEAAEDEVITTDRAKELLE
jgi:phosphohistidine swiveling domain-containing protein